MSQEIIPYSTLQQASLIADEVARQNVLADFLERKSLETLRSFAVTLKAFDGYLREAGIHQPGIVLDIEHWQEAVLDLSGWRNITYGIIRGFIRWQLKKGYSINTVNKRLSTIKTFCSLAYKAGYINQAEFSLIQLVKGFAHKEKARVDSQREVKRIGAKKEEANTLEKEQVALLKNQPATAQGWRDRVIICLFFDHGVRCGELALLKRSSVNMTTGKVIIYREKTNKYELHQLTGDTLLSLLNYLQYAQLSENDQLIRGSRCVRGEVPVLVGGMTKRALTKRVNTLGKKLLEIKNLSAHDGRHSWATSAIKAGTSLIDLMHAGGWSTPNMPTRYIKQQEVTNQKVKLEY